MAGVGAGSSIVVVFMILLLLTFVVVIIAFIIIIVVVVHCSHPGIFVKVMLNGCRLEFRKVRESIQGVCRVHVGFFRKGNKQNLASTCKKLRCSV